MKHFVYSLIFALSLVSCGGRAARGTQAPKQSAAPARAETFRPVLPSAMIPPEEQADYAREHFWDAFRFADSAYVAAQDSASMLQYFALYATRIAMPDAAGSLSELMRRAGASRHAFRYFMGLAEIVLHDPNSPMRNDELYIPVLEAAVASPHLDEYEKAVPMRDLHLARQNRVGHPANDFAYLTVDGSRGTLYGLKAEYTLLFFSNPGCPMCHDIQQQAMVSGLLHDMVVSGRAAVLMLYPDEDVEAWRGYASGIPSDWIYARDAKQRLRDESLYDLKAIPALYLLDRDKRVVVKDAADMAVIERAVAACESARGV